MKLNIPKLSHCKLLAFMLPLLFNCSRKAVVLGPKEFYIKPKIATSLSTINVIGEVSTAQTELLMNTKLPDILYSDTNIEDDNYTVIVSKRTSFVLEPDDKFIYITTPLKIEAKARLNVGFIKAEQGGIFDLDVRFKLQPKISKDWELNSMATIDSYSWINEPKVKLGPFEISVAPYLEKMIVAQQDQISKKIDDMVKKSIDIKAFAQKAWSYSQLPIPLNTSINAWTKIDPKSVYFIPIKGTKDKIKFGLGINANIETTIGERPYGSICTLPSISMGNATDTLFSVNLLSKIGFAEASTIANEKLRNTEFTFNNNKYKIKLEDISFYGSGEYLVAKTSLSGDYNGLLYLYGIPSYDSTTSTIKIRNLDYTAESLNGLKRTYGWLFKGNITKKLSEQIEFSLNNKASKAAESLSAYINNIKLSEKIKIDAKVFSLNPDKIIIAENQLIVSIGAKGKINLKIDVSELK